MIHLRYDWRRRILWALICLVFFLSSQTPWSKKRADEMAGKEMIMRDQQLAKR
ncbi:MAG: hypothetical protein QM737_01960 [Ferruginibacter sp.]